MSKLKWVCLQSGQWEAKADGWEWQAWELVNPSEWDLTGWRPGPDQLWHYTVRTLAEARKLAATVMAQVQEEEAA